MPALKLSPALSHGLFYHLVLETAALTLPLPLKQKLADKTLVRLWQLCTTRVQHLLDMGFTDGELSMISGALQMYKLELGITLHSSTLAAARIRSSVQMVEYEVELMRLFHYAADHRISPECRWMIEQDLQTARPKINAWRKSCAQKGAVVNGQDEYGFNVYGVDPLADLISTSHWMR